MGGMNSMFEIHDSTLTDRVLLDGWLASRVVTSWKVVISVRPARDDAESFGSIPAEKMTKSWGDWLIWDWIILLSFS